MESLILISTFLKENFQELPLVKPIMVFDLEEKTILRLHINPNYLIKRFKLIDNAKDLAEAMNLHCHDYLWFQRYLNYRDLLKDCGFLEPMIDTPEDYKFNYIHYLNDPAPFTQVFQPICRKWNEWLGKLGIKNKNSDPTLPDF